MDLDLDNSPSKPNEAYKMIVSKAQFLNKLAKQKSEDVQKIFSPMFAQIDEFESRYLEIVSQVEKFGITDQLIKKAKRLRLDLRPIRTTAEAERTREKAEYLVAGKAIDEASKAVQNVVKEKEEVLLGIEKYHENIEKQRIENLQNEREALLSVYLEDTDKIELGSMSQEMFDAFYNSQVTKEAERKENERKEKEAEKKREAEIEAQRIENAKLKAEAIERERLVKIETDKRLEAEAKLKAKADAEIQAEIKAKTQAKEMAEKPLKVQFSDWIRNLQLPNPPADTHEAREILEKFESFKAWAQREIERS